MVPDAAVDATLSFLNDIGRGPYPRVRMVIRDADGYRNE
jgi:hypothetical protein